jgi:hypothetical protein
MLVPLGRFSLAPAAERPGSPTRMTLTSGKI